MPLVSMTTNLKSLRFGNDTVGGGNSNQPYIVTPIPEKFSDIGRTGGPDFLLRGGTLLPRVTVQDTSRLFKMFFDFRSPSGPLFVVKQNVLSLSNVNSSAGYVSWTAATRSRSGNFLQRLGSSIGTFVRNNIAINQGIYTPLSTLGQAAGNSLGIHLNKQGINPFRGTTQGSPGGNTPLGLPTYLNTIASEGREGNKSRLISLTSKIDTKTTGNNLYTYLGGPGAILGVGRTTISMVSDQRTGINNPNLNFTSTFNNNLTSTTGNIAVATFSGLANVSTTSIKYVGSKYNSPQGLNSAKNPTGGAFDLNGLTQPTPNLQLAYGASIKYFSTLPSLAYNSPYYNNNWLDVSGVITPLSPSVYQPGGGLITNTVGNKLNSGWNGTIPTQVFTQEQINGYIPTSKDYNINKESFTTLVAPSGSNSIPKSVSYIYQNIDKRVNLGNPGARGNLSSYVIGKRVFDPSGTALSGSVSANSGYKNALDTINAFPLYQSTVVTDSTLRNDLVKFRIGVIDNDNPKKKTYIHFRAFIDSFSDQYSSDWKSQRYMGRGENFYKYDGFNREISLSWTVAAQSKQELIPMYQKLNYLASVCAPDYSQAGYMRGNLISLTIGGWCYEQIGIMKGITLDVPDDSPWEIGISDGIQMGENFQNLSSDASVKELPMIIKVTGFTFTPIHDFVPQLQQNEYNGNSPGTNGGNFISNYGKERYIGLAAAEADNYSGGTAENSTDGNLNYIPRTVNFSAPIQSLDSRQIPTSIRG
jgi:hypothetical protein